MTIFKNLLQKKKIIFRCNYCNAEITASIKAVQQLEIENAHDPLCPVKQECHYCHMGFVLPVFYQSKNGTIYTFDDLAEKIPHLDENALLERIFHEDLF